MALACEMTATQLNHDIAKLPVGMVSSRRFQVKTLGCRRGIKHDDWHEPSQVKAGRMYRFNRVLWSYTTAHS